MSEYFAFEVEPTEHPNCLFLGSNLSLASNGREEYSSRDEGGLGSPLAQTLFSIPGLVALSIEDRRLILWREPDVEWYALVNDVTSAIKDFFL